MSPFPRPLGVSLAVIVIAGLAGLLLSRVLDGDEPAPARQAAAAPLALELSGGWTRSRSIPRIGTIELERPLAIVPRRAAGWWRA